MPYYPRAWKSFPDIDDDLALASVFRREVVVQFLPSPKGQRRSGGKKIRPYFGPVWKSYDKVNDLLLSKGASLDEKKGSRDDPPLACAAAADHTEVVRSMLNTGIILNGQLEASKFDLASKTSELRSPIKTEKSHLIQAAEHENFDIRNILLAREVELKAAIGVVDSGIMHNDTKIE
ncbi:MAG: hypothetical protein ALECFALPRED_005191 [Alectoria fallacina]|uniref:Uncharacterized protein n=1 Tax=Alectoria fallacina TaxID=1903189 RepID=A0A8H3ENV5_9LECA|nr:MAG: hypothetical protein ALECFALPRED_005191 [Alectoria fallacina]